MDTQKPHDGEQGNHGDTSPRWWTAKHAIAWEAAKEALRRDWEQTVVDLTKNGGAPLPHALGDTPRQANGSQLLPPRAAETRPDGPVEFARRAQRELEARRSAQEKVAAAHAEVAAALKKADDKIAQARRQAQVKVVKIQKKIAEISAESHAAIEEAEREGQGRLAKMQVKIDAVRAEASKKVAKVCERTDAKIAEERGKITEAHGAWTDVEPAVRYGYCAHAEYVADPTWGDAIEGRLRADWSALAAGRPWEEARPFVRFGWDAFRPGRG